MSNVRSYTDTELLDKVKSLPTFKIIPLGHWIIAVRSNEDSMTFDDKFYLFNGSKFVMVTSGTTNKGNKGTAVLCSNVITYDCYATSNGKTVRHHKDKMRCLRQVKSIPYQRDYSIDGKTNPTTKIFTDIISTNFHACTYDMASKVIKKDIGGWSEGCLVCNNIPDYLKILDLVKEQKYVSLALLQEF